MSQLCSLFAFFFQISFTSSFLYLNPYIMSCIKYEVWDGCIICVLICCNLLPYFMSQMSAEMFMLACRDFFTFLKIQFKLLVRRV